jgi:hypothetical protein
MSNQESNALAARSIGGRNGRHAASSSILNISSVVGKEGQRPLEVIAAELNSTLKRETTDIIKIGGLLTEAKAQLTHGKWLAWVAEHFALSKSTVANYINAYKFAVQFPNIGNLKIRPSTLYTLASGMFKAEEIAIILKKAETEWVGSTITGRKKPEVIGTEHRRAPRTKSELKLQSKPSLPEVMSAKGDRCSREQFAAAVQALENLRTQPSTKFVGIISASCLLIICDFLHQVAAISGGAT